MNKHNVDRISKQLRDSESYTGSNLCYHSRNSNELNGLTYNDVNDVLKKSTLSANNGTVGFISEEVMQSVLEPSSSRKRACAAWLRRYCAEYTDCDPTNLDCYCCASCKEMMFMTNTRTLLPLNWQYIALMISLCVFGNSTIFGKAISHI